jgi:four helix bundle protein
MILCFADCHLQKEKNLNDSFQGDVVIAGKSYRFAVRIVKLCQYLCGKKREYIISQQLERSGTSIRANIAEGQQGQSRADFIAKMSVALKETSETKYWLSLLHDTGYLTEREYHSIPTDCIKSRKT